MVKVCDEIYLSENESEYQSYYNQYSYPLYDFQKWAIEAIVTGNHLLVCCPTGSGKTFCGEFAITYFHQFGKKTIYASPIKALSNEKYHQFREKYPQLSVGLITGDIKINPNADVLIMTTEILLNKLHNVKSNNSFDMNLETELASVIFDEIHMINDENRGHVWEQSIMMLPAHVQMIGLSATLHNPCAFAAWIESQHSNKITYFTHKKHRAVPLTHYLFLATNSSIYKLTKDKELNDRIAKYTHKTHVIQDANGTFNEPEFNQCNKMLNLFRKHRVEIKRKHVLNKLSEFLVQNEMLPALCYVFSRKQLELCASEITTNLLEFDSKVPYTADRECEHLIRKLPNYEEYLRLSEYQIVVQLMRKGIGMHHAGMIPVLREITEIMFTRGFIKILFCTETMSVGINLPVKTTIFTDLMKFGGKQRRMLYSHEYTQSAGRAGRLGLDSIGHVVHLPNLFSEYNICDCKMMMSGQSQHITSKFKISYLLLLQLRMKNVAPIHFIDQSIMQTETNHEIRSILSEIELYRCALTKLQFEYDSVATPHDIITEYDTLMVSETLKQGQRKKKESQMQTMKEMYSSLLSDYKMWEVLVKMKSRIEFANKEYNVATGFLQNQIDNIMTVLEKNGFGENAMLEKVAVCLKELPSLTFAKLLTEEYDRLLCHITATEWVVIFGCFINVSVKEKEMECSQKNRKIANVMKYVSKSLDDLDEMETKNRIVYRTSSDYEIQYDLIDILEKWCSATNEMECKQIIETEKGIFIGEFVKGLLKINNIVIELQEVCELTNNVALLHTIQQIPPLIMKYIVTNQSLYV